MLKATKTTWVARDKNGELQAIRVVDMDDAHLYRWVQYFRKKFREEGLPPTMPDAVVDARIRARLVTAPAIYAEAWKRGLFPGQSMQTALTEQANGFGEGMAAMGAAAKATADSMTGMGGAMAKLITALGATVPETWPARPNDKPTPAAPDPEPGVRRITLEDD